MILIPSDLAPGVQGDFEELDEQFRSKPEVEEIGNVRSSSYSEKELLYPTN